MRGPYERLKYDFRRVWECPACNQRRRTGGDVTGNLCACSVDADNPQRTPMKLVADGGRRTDVARGE